jgi:MFS family permease
MGNMILSMPKMISRRTSASRDLVVAAGACGRSGQKALGVFGCVIGVAAIAGQILVGLLLAADIWGLTWRPIFLINVPLALGTIVAAAFVLPKIPRGCST